MRGTLFVRKPVAPLLGLQGEHVDADLWRDFTEKDHFGGEPSGNEPAVNRQPASRKV